ncbi:hydrogenase formation protein HypD [Geovibrio thiophilus]|uniref:Hydrogenase formation protein HypD n=1 Tax=Geovibrio thiophilus TaxID=139438 RepID=A0A3R6AWW6_9BACT|nr:hydrogenase formation protein HypD [Geovibrio thiophilus]QAR32370.1 hydrogenase formation protein HypD [Geovibrio thiophilus]
MKFVKDFRDRELAEKLLAAISREADTSRVYRFMEVCGSHTMAVSRFGLRSLLPKNIELVSGPGCPVCVTPQWEIDAIFEIASREDVTIVTFGDMIRVPGSRGESLQKLRADGADIRIVFSPLDTLKIAEETGKNTVFIGIGFETTAPTAAALAKTAKELGTANVFVAPFCKTVPEVMDVLLADETLEIDGFLCPGHVSVVTGLDIYKAVTAQKRSAVVTGFEPLDILSSVLEMVRQHNKGEYEVKNFYTRAVKNEGNLKAQALLKEVFYQADTDWRGLGRIPKSGLRFRDEYQSVDALAKFGIQETGVTDLKGCKCGDVLKGKMKPSACPMFDNGCTPQNPYGPCMVSSEGSCSAYYKYER